MKKFIIALFCLFMFSGQIIYAQPDNMDEEDIETVYILADLFERLDAYLEDQSFGVFIINDEVVEDIKSIILEDVNSSI